MKDDSLYSQGMKPFVYSMTKKTITNIGWHWGGVNIIYSSNGQIIRTSSKTVRLYYYVIK